MKVAVVGAGSVNNEKGGAESLYKGLVLALNELDVNTELICPISDERSFTKIKESYLQFYDLDLSGYDGVISTKAPAYMVRHHNHICYLMHTMRIFYDMLDFEFRQVTPELLSQRDFIHSLDTAALKFPRTRQIFVIGNEVKNRLLRFNGLDSTVLYPGLLNDNYKTGQFEYVFLPGRLHRWKRVDLVIKAMHYVKSPINLFIAGIGEDEEKLKQLAKGDSRIKFLGRVTDEEMISLYSNALCVPFVPVHEDFGYITIEAFRSGKPIITCLDSGEPTYIVRNSENGFVCNPDPKEIAERIDFLYQNPEDAREMGCRGKLSIQDITWKATAKVLMQSLQLS